MGEAATAIIELAVGSASLAAAVGAWRVRRMRWLGLVLAAAGLAAVGHAALWILG